MAESIMFTTAIFVPVNAVNTIHHGSILRACPRVKQSAVPQTPSYDEDEDERTEKRITAMVKATDAASSHQQEGCHVIKELLGEFDHVQRDRVARLRIAEKVFKAVLQYDAIIIRNKGFRDTVYKKIQELTADLDEFNERVQPRVDQLSRHIAEASAFVEQLPSQVTESVTIKSYLNAIAALTKGIPNVYDDSHLRALFAKVLAHPAFQERA
jgi:hypothetical protein